MEDEVGVGDRNGAAVGILRSLVAGTTGTVQRGRRKSRWQWESERMDRTQPTCSNEGKGTRFLDARVLAPSAEPTREESRRGL